MCYMCCVLYQWVCIIYCFTASKSVSTARKILNYFTGSQPSTKSLPVIAGANKDIIQTAEGISITIKRGSIPDEQVLFYIYINSAGRVASSGICLVWGPFSARSVARASPDMLSGQLGLLSFSVHGFVIIYFVKCIKCFIDL